MEELTYFVSYAREDSEVVLTLATELRAVGAKLWLDQLDIVAGQRWDRAVEEGLATIQGLIVVLSPAAVASHNVMDEVSYALEEGKPVIPILLRPCAIPFRLRRVQYIDLTASYETGFSHLLRALRLGQPLPCIAPAAPQEPLVRDVSAPSQEMPQTASSRDQRPVETASSEPETPLAQVEPITVILTALASGAAAVAKETAGEALKDAYRGLKALIQRKFADKPEAALVLAKHAEKPAVWEAPLKEALTAAAADRDAAILTAAQQLMALIDPQQAALGKYTVHIAGNVQGVVQGDHAQVTMSFGSPAERK
jgi:hypothetical protein